MKKRVLLIVAVVIFLLGGVFAIGTGISRIRKKQKAHDLEREIKHVAADFKGEFAYTVKEFRFLPFELAKDSDKQFIAASLVKLPIMAVAFQAVKDGKISLDDSIAITRKDIAGGSGILKARKLPVELEFRELVEIMISKSDNTATNKIIDLLGYDYISGLFNEWGLHDTILERKMMDFVSRRKGKENYTSCRDLAVILEKIYQGQCINKEYSLLMRSFLENQKIKDRLPRYLPEGTVVAHKTGLEKKGLHDCGIVFSEGGDYIICVLTSPGSSGYAAAKKFIAKISLVVYDSLNETP